MPTFLAFRTPPGGVVVLDGARKSLGTFDTAQYTRLRVSVGEVGAPVSTTGVTIRLVLIEGNESAAQLDAIALGPGTTVDRLYDVPGTTVEVIAEAAPGAASDKVIVFIWGST